MNAGDTVLEVEALTIAYDKVTAVEGVSLRVRKGRICTIVGSNGAGKTTLMKAIAGLLRPREGSIRFEGQEIAGLACDAVVRRGISLVPEGRRLFGGMSVLENLMAGAYLRSDPIGVRRSLEQVFAYFPILQERQKARASSLSGGQQQMLAVGRSLMAAPRLLMLDEPSIGLAPVVVDKIVDIITTVSGGGVDVLLVEQNAAVALDVARDAYVLENGRIAMEGEASVLAGSDEVRAAYLGM